MLEENEQNNVCLESENLVIFVFAHKILMAAGKKLACTNVLSGTQNNEHT